MSTSITHLSLLIRPSDMHIKVFIPNDTQKRLTHQIKNINRNCQDN